MEFEQLEKRIDWLDEERRKDKNKIEELEDKILSLEGILNATQKKNTELDGDITRLRTTIARVDDFDEELSNIRVDNGRTHKDFEKQMKSWIANAKKLLRSRIDGVNTSVEQLRANVDTLEFEKQLTARKEEEARLSKTITEIKKTVVDVQSSSEEQIRNYRLVTGERQKETKRLTDLRGEVTAARKRLDEQRGRMELVEVDTKRNKTRLEELSAQRRELIREQGVFLEEETLLSVEREKTWKVWRTRFEAIEKQASEIDVQIQSLDSTHRAVKHTQKDVTELSEQLDRRVNEITEMQRLAEERSRHEWNTFKADDKKRWMNYTLSQKEQRDEEGRHIRKIGERVTILEDTIQEMEDQVRQIGTQTAKQLQNLLTLTHDWVSEHEQIMDSIR